MGRRSWIVLATWACALWLSAAASAGAHEFRPARLTVRVDADDASRVDLEWVPPVTTSRGVVTDALRPRMPAHCRPHPRMPSRYHCGTMGLAGTLTVEGLDRHPTDVWVEIVQADGTTWTERLSPTAPSMSLRAGVVVDSAMRAVTSYLRLGAIHVLSGLDHLMLLLGLLLLVRSPRALLIAVTGFTVGHATSIVAVTLGGVTVPSAPVEAAIALSIVCVAVEVRRGPPSLGHRYPGAMALAIGLLHGLGFAGALTEVGLPAGHLPAALLGFNLGVEAGQLAVVLVACAIGAALQRRIDDARLRRGLAFGLGHVAAAWTIARCVALGGGA